MQSEAIIKAAIECDATIDPEQRERILNALEPAPKKPKAVLITTKEAAALLGVHIVTLRRYSKDGKLTPIRYSARKIRWNRNEVEILSVEGVV